MDADAAVEFVAQAIHEKRPDWTIEQTREMVRYARKSISTNPQRFIDLFLDNLANLQEAAAAREP